MGNTDTAERTVNIVGAGLAGLSGAIHLAQAGIRSRLISSQPSERAQSVLAEGGINGALNTMGEDDCTENHFRDTMKAGGEIADPEAVRDLTEHAPDVLRWLDSLGVPFRRKNGLIQQRNFGGQKKKRTAYAESSIGKVLMTALIDEARKYEAAGTITRYAHHDFAGLILTDGGKMCAGLQIRDSLTGDRQAFAGPVLMASGGLAGFFPGRTTGTTANTGDAAALLFSQGVLFSNLEMIQYHPTTLAIPHKRLLVSEAARGEGGRLYIQRGAEKWYFMEEKYPELGNLMPRDVVSREEYFVMHDPACGGQVFLDCTGLSAETWAVRLPDLRREVRYYTGLDPAKKPIPVEPGIHYFMGGIDTDACHRTNVRGLYAAGECCSLYHGANRLGGNSTLGAVYGGGKAAQTIAEEIQNGPDSGAVRTISDGPGNEHDIDLSSHFDETMGSILYESLGVVRSREGMEEGLRRLGQLDCHDRRERSRMALAAAMIQSALLRTESRGAQYRSDMPEKDARFQGMTTAQYAGGEAVCGFRPQKQQSV